MSNFKLNLPTDIPWKRICVTEDMVDQVMCDESSPPKWHSSLAVFKFVPEDEFQLFPDYKITYLKVTATITGYQPLDEEIQGEIDWDGLDVGTLEGITELLTSYYPCNGAILQVIVGPKENNPHISKENYPFFLDFEPKKRELYELATDTKEKQSRSIETVNISKSAGQTQSQEVMDIDMGGSTSLEAQGSYAGSGGGFKYGTSSQGQWGTKQLNSQESMEMRSTETGQEKRESYSFTTNISQMYNQLNSYHIGTNRVIFFVQPRPHVLEEPTGFVRGPRAVEGIQEFFMVVAQPKEQEDLCVSLRLDTGHLTIIPIMDYEKKPVLSDTALAIANLPTSLDTVETREIRCTVDYLAFDDDIYYKKHIKQVTNSVPYQAPNGFRIENWSDAVYNIQNGSSNVALAADGRSLTINVEARSSVWLQDEGDGWFAECPDQLEQMTGRAERRLRINLISDSPTKQIGVKEMLLITTRGLCCCPASEVSEPGVLIRGVKSVPDYFGGILRYDIPTYIYKATPADTRFESARQAEATLSRAADSEIASYSKSNSTISKNVEGDCGCEQQTTRAFSPLDKKMPIRQANEMIGFIKDEILKSMVDPRPENAPKPFVETDFFVKKLQAALSSVRSGRNNLNKKIGTDLPREVRKKLEDKFGKKADEITVYDLLTLRNYELGKLAKMNSDEVARFKISQLGIKFKQKDKPTKRRKN